MVNFWVTLCPNINCITYSSASHWQPREMPVAWSAVQGEWNRRLTGRTLQLLHWRVWWPKNSTGGWNEFPLWGQDSGREAKISERNSRSHFHSLSRGACWAGSGIWSGWLPHVSLGRCLGLCTWRSPRGGLRRVYISHRAVKCLVLPEEGGRIAEQRMVWMFLGNWSRTWLSCSSINIASRMTLIFTKAKKWAEWDVLHHVSGYSGVRFGKENSFLRCSLSEPTWSKPIGHVLWGPSNNPKTSC